MKIKHITLISSLFLFPYLNATAASYIPEDPTFDIPSFNFPTTNSQSNKFKKIHQQVTKLLNAKQFQAADEKINELIQQFPDTAQLYSLLGSSQLQQKKYQLANTSFQKAIALDKTSTTALLGAASASLQENNLNQAKKYTNDAIALDHNSISAFLFLAKINSAQKNAPETEKALLRAKEIAQGKKEQELFISTKLAAFYTEQNQPQKALSLIQAINKKHPNNSHILSILADLQLLTHQAPQAIPTLEKIIALESQDTRHRLLLAQLLSRSPEKQQQVLKLLNEAQSIPPNDIDKLSKITNLLIQSKHYTEALSLTKKIKQLSPNSGFSEVLEGQTYAVQNKNQQALASFQKSYQISPNPQILGAITKLMIKQGKTTEAIHFLEQEIEKNPENLIAHFRLATILQKQSKLQEAEKHYLVILNKQPDNTLALNNLASIYSLQNNPKAIILAEKAYQKSPNSLAIMDTYASILVQNGQVKKGLAIAEESAKLAPQNNDVQYHLASAYVANKQKQQAIKILSTITNSQQDFSEKQAAIKLLNQLK